MSDTRDMARRCFSVLRESLAAAASATLALQETASSWRKADLSPVTEADIAVTRLVREKLAPLLAEGHVLLDEETADAGGAARLDAADPPEFLWTLDPVGGTVAYANRLPFFGAYMGLLRKGRPWIGGVALPALGEIFLCDGESAWMETRDGGRREIAPGAAAAEPGPDAVIFASPRWKPPFGRRMEAFTLAIGLCYPLVGRGLGTVTRPKLWDLAGAWPIIRAAGFSLSDIETGREMESLADLRLDAQFRCGRGLLLAHPDHAEGLRRGFAGRAHG
jgi:fructose-1,6-bisphosphatase/inositol monophosphatase family enzyme